MSDEQRPDDSQHSYIKRITFARRKSDKFWRGAAIALLLAALKAYSAYQAQHDELVRNAVTKADVKEMLEPIKENVTRMQSANERTLEWLQQLTDEQAKQRETIENLPARRTFYYYREPN